MAGELPPPPPSFAGDLPVTVLNRTASAPVNRRPRARPRSLASTCSSARPPRASSDLGITPERADLPRPVIRSSAPVIGVGLIPLPLHRAGSGPLFAGKTPVSVAGRGMVPPLSAMAPALTPRSSRQASTSTTNRYSLCRVAAIPLPSPAAFGIADLLQAGSPMPPRDPRPSAGTFEAGLQTTFRLTGTETAADFEVICLLGQGGFGVVKKVQHKGSGMLMAVKELNDPTSSPEHDSASSAIAHLRDEINTMMGSVDCAFIVKYHGVNFRNGRVFIYMEPLAASLDKCYDVLKQRDGIPFPEFVLTYIAISILKAMLYLKHQLNVLHRDIKPQNILAGSEGEVKVTDFGLAKAMGSGSFARTKGVGSKIYKAPERIDGASSEGYGTEADVWSYGITLVELGRLEYPFASKSEFEIMAAVVEGRPPRLPGLYSPDMQDFVEACLEKVKDERPRLHKPAPNKPSNVALQDTSFYRDNSERDYTGSREWLQKNVIHHLSATTQPHGGHRIKVDV